ncbi:unnamed protein product [Rotaria socialis]|uniref:G-protein coupled receptors family 1 profile domain-containing protein n=1 Tax=Rotaria socialis TaxID=392032 RepID=A0A820I8X3_9BILA|nr:unnamed protein product [Rotaria socialis]CAF3373580.1 unnamed protein product [Rotaria socialis]CAF3413672.1 unnamed protein product [Rotaria socialis]CAF3525135.1 unnamed protein product [Rotaria socialis]CAF3775943.1 unnamed protein product [Rotaria socialis]
MDAVNAVAHQLMIILGIIMFIFGLIGNILNIYVFLSWCRLKKKSRRRSRNARSSNSSLYLLTSSISNLIIIIFPFLTRIIFDGFQYSLNQRNGFILCKLRYYVLHTFDLTSLTCICMATFDRYLISSRQVRLRHMSTVRKRTKQVILFVITLNILHSIPIGFFFDVSNQGRCTILSRKFLYYYLWTFQICFHSLIPILFLTIFGVLTYRQLKKIKRTKRKGVLGSDKRLSRMLLLMSAAIVLSSIPYCIEHVYNVLIRKDPFKQPSYIYLYHVITSILFYTNPVTSFYIFFISTPNFRKQVRKLFFCTSSDCNYDTESFTMITTLHNSHE